MMIKSLMLVILSIFANLQNAHADARPAYEMRNMTTSLRDYDVDYFSQPIVLIRTAKTSALHWVEFNVNYFEKYCTYWESRCVQTDSHGNCTRWEQVCAQWALRSTPTGKRIQLNFRKATPLAANEEETLQLRIQRMQPVDEGEDRVSTDLRAEKVLKPVSIRRFDDFSYTIETK